MRKKLVFVIEDTDSDGHFSFYLDGDKDRLSDAGIPDNELTPAEYWAAMLYRHCFKILEKNGLIKNKIDTRDIIH